MRAELAIIGAAASLLAGGAAFAGRLDKSSEAAIAKMLDIVAPVGDRIGAIQYGELAPGQVVSLPFDGDRTHEYYINAICDDDCTDLNLAVLDASGVEIDVDDADDNAPVLNVLPDLHQPPSDTQEAEPRPMTIEVRMIGCEAASCAYGVMITRTE